MANVRMWLGVLVFLPLAVTFPARASITPELLDYLIQDVCVDGNNNVIAGDPAACPNHRNMQIGEKSPYIVTDFDRNNNNATYEASLAIPVMGMDGATRVLNIKNLQGNFDGNFQWIFDQSRDGYDEVDYSTGTFVSFIRTSDPGCWDQMWSHDGSDATIADRANGWVLFPINTAPSAWDTTNSTSGTTYHVQVTPNLSGCTDNNSNGVTYWNSPMSYTFETFKVMTAIRSDHFAAIDLSSGNNVLERYYFTKEYGFTRWEAWVPQSRCYSQYGSTNPICQPQSASYPLAGRCGVLNVSTTGTPGLDTWGGQYWVRVDCRDHTNYIALNQPQTFVDTVIAQNDGFVDIDSAASLNPTPLGFWNAASPQNGHNVGAANGVGWSVAANTGYANLTYGPYVTGLPAGHLNATFSLMEDNNSADNNSVVEIQVYRWSDNTIFADQTITRQQFNAANALQNFTLPFTYDGVGALEFRVFVYGNSYIYQQSSQVGY